MKQIAKWFAIGIIGWFFIYSLGYYLIPRYQQFTYQVGDISIPEILDTRTGKTASPLQVAPSEVRGFNLPTFGFALLFVLFSLLGYGLGLKGKKKIFYKEAYLQGLKDAYRVGKEHGIDQVDYQLISRLDERYSSVRDNKEKG